MHSIFERFARVSGAIIFFNLKLYSMGKFFKLKLLSVLLSFILLLGCSGPSGPQGPLGPQGPAGADGLIAEVFDVTANFNPGNNFTAAFSLDPPIFDSDVVMIYLRWQTFEGQPIWRALPITHLDQGNLLLYYFDFTSVDFVITMDSNIPLTTWGPEFTQDQVFRVAIIPGSFLEEIEDLNDYESVMKVLQADL
jgi:hypothetical protein